MHKKTLFILAVTMLLTLTSVIPAYAEEVDTSGMTAEEIEKLGPGYAAKTQEAGAVQATGERKAGIRELDPSKPMIALTYDDGPNAGPGNRIMDVFLQYGQRCTFFVVGNRIATYQTEMKRMADEGFEIANHSWSHSYYNKLSSEQIAAEVQRCNAEIFNYTGVTPTLARTPGGMKSDKIKSSVNMPMILWNVDTRDWKTRNADSTVNAVLGKVKDGDIVLMHELYSSTASATERLVPELVARGYQLVTVSELAYYKGIDLTAGQYYFSFN